jgi:hypothetical protein
MRNIFLLLIAMVLVACSGGAVETLSDDVVQTAIVQTQAAQPTNTEATTKTPIPTNTASPLPTNTLTETPPTEPAATPAQSITALGQAQEIGQWKIMVVNSDLTDTITTPEGSYISSEGRGLYLVELEIKNTVEVPNILQVDPHEIEVVDSEGETYMSIGVAPIYDTFLLHIYHVGGSVGLSAEQVDGGPTVTLTATAIDENTKEWKIELSDEGSAKITMAFEISSDVQVKELHWPGLLPFSLKK